MKKDKIEYIQSLSNMSQNYLTVALFICLPIYLWSMEQKLPQVRYLRHSPDTLQQLCLQRIISTRSLLFEKTHMSTQVESLIEQATTNSLQDFLDRKPIDLDCAFWLLKKKPVLTLSCYLNSAHFLKQLNDLINKPASELLCLENQWPEQCKEALLFFLNEKYSFALRKLLAYKVMVTRPEACPIAWLTAYGIPTLYGQPVSYYMPQKEMPTIKSHDGRYSLGVDGYFDSIFLKDLEGREEVRIAFGAPECLSELARIEWSNDDNYALLCGIFGIFMLDMRALKTTIPFKGEALTIDDSLCIHLQKTPFVYSVVFSTDGEYILSKEKDTWYVWDLKPWRKLTVTQLLTLIQKTIYHRPLLKDTFKDFPESLKKILMQKQILEEKKEASKSDTCRLS